MKLASYLQLPLPLLSLRPMINKPYLLTLLFLVFTTFSLSAQEYTPPPVWRGYLPVTATTIDSLIEGNSKLMLGAQHITDSLYPITTPLDSLPQGHYLAVNIQGETISYSILQHFPYELWVGSRRKKLAVRLFSETGQDITTAELKVDGRRLRWSERDSAYLRRDWKVEQLQAIIGTDTLFYQLADKQHYSRLRTTFNRAQRNPLGYVLLLPVRAVDNTIRYIDRGLSRNDWSWHRYPFDRWINNRSISIYGYASSSQPSYRTGDSVQLSFFCSKASGRPIKDSMTIFVENGWGEQRFERQLGARSQAPGHYTVSFMIDDAWPLDKNFTVRPVFSKHRRWQFSQRLSFLVEDYQLEEYELSLTAPETVLPAEVLKYTVQAQDVNGLPIPNGRLEMQLIFQQALQAEAGYETLLPDTLWSDTLMLSQQTELTLSIPDSVLPEHLLSQVILYVELFTPGGESQEAQQVIELERRGLLLPKIEYEAGQIMLFSLQAQPGDSAQLTRFYFDDRRTETVYLPDTIALEPEVQSYHLELDNSIDRLRQAQLLQEARQDLNWPGLALLSPKAVADLQTDSLPAFHPGARIYLPLPPQFHLHFRWSVRSTDDRVLFDGSAADLPTYFELPANEEEVRVDFRWRLAGEWVTAHQNLSWQPAELAIEIDQPATVLPGEEVEVTLRVRDQQNQPVAGVSLTSGTYNARFEEQPFSNVSARARRRGSRISPTFSLREYWDNSGTLSNSPHLIETLYWDSLRYFQILYPELEYVHYRPLPAASQSPAELAVFIANDGRLENIRTISVNNEVLYYDLAWGTTPYSIPIDTGLQRIAVRTDRGIFSKTLHLKAAQQFVISFDSQRAGSAGWSEEQMDNFPTSSEWNSLKSRLFGLQPLENKYRYSGVRQVQRTDGFVYQNTNSHSDQTYLGLFNQQDRLDYFDFAVDSVRLLFESGFFYDINQARDRLYPIRRLSQRRGNNSAQRQPGFCRYIPKERGQSFFQVREELWQGRTTKPEGEWPGFQLNINGDDGFYQILHVEGGDTSFVVAPYRLSTYRLEAGDYSLSLLVKGDSIKRRKINLQNSDLRLLATNHTDWKTEVLSDSLSVYLTEEVRYEAGVIPSMNRNIHIGETSGNYLMGQVLGADNHHPLAFATVAVFDAYEQLITGSTTDLDGIFYFPHLIEETYSIEVSYTGFQSKRVTFNSPPKGNIGAISLEEGVALSSVIVVGYSRADELKRRRNERFLSIRGSRSNASYYYVDGIRVQSPQVQQDNTTQGRPITAMDIGRLPTRNINALAGSVSGVTISSHDLNPFRGDEYDQLMASPTLSTGLRNSFADLAHYAPFLMTDERGEVRFRIQYPDDITAWNTFAIGQDRRRRAGIALHQSQAYLPVQAQLYLPRFLVEGDKSTALGLALNREDEALNVELQFGDGQTSSSREEVQLETAIERSYAISAPLGVDSIHQQFGLVNDDLQDGEARGIQVFPAGTEVCNGRLDYVTDGHLLIGDGFDPALGDLELSVLSRPTDFLRHDIDYLQQYPYDCNEQLAGKLIGYLAEKQLTGSLSRRNDGEVRRALEQFGKRQLPSGGYGWWPGQDKASLWISLHIFRTLLAAEHQGYFPRAIAPLQQFLLTEIQPAQPSLQAQLLLVLAEADRLNDLDYRLRQIDTLAQTDTYYQLVSTRLRQIRGDSIDWQSVVDSGQDYYGRGRYWVPDHPWTNRQPLAARTAATLLAYQILMDAGQEQSAAPALFYLLSKGDQSTHPYARMGRNSLESGILVLGLQGLLSTSQEASLLNGPTIQLVRGSSISPLTEDYHELLIGADQIRTAELRVQTGTVVVSRRQCRWEIEPTATENGMQVQSQWTGLSVSAQDKRGISTSEVSYLEAIIELPEDADYVLVEIPIPAGAEYADRNEYRGPSAVHREYRRDRVVVFCDRLAAGSHRFKVALRGRFPGSYTQNPVRAELQYLPAVNANSSVQQLNIR